MASIDALQQELIADFALFDDWTGKYEYLIDLGRKLPLIDEKYKTDAYRIKGCQSQVWLHAEVRDGRMVFTADSDAIITKGIIALLVHVLSEQPVQEVADADLYFIDRIGLREHLSPTRSNGLMHMIDKMQSLARACAPQV
jgi:cysteine desulfuration protein SufE